ncbi:Dpi8p CYBJADRAFT_9178 [Cyberlindnera jadinii NRRL Y-1542]|uniref:Uncharacterized protein n=1 Tax=Cyberlindnera jadinii (strain ATCC 18201 / CBS 1600 / BCRC 20928 / JCM 3617 / NBRC 0987 / NRRL Y-1542) TaxID=983966 RepID=A0A1E4S9S8_CYBJN|nr:hypothetical protein CYBJADRAFT_69540 [Cyberlindnera jadinii NRRL Y-1542]XP_020073298.1 hypothetical protein CYBJADRAFT_9178 [Cyberlindnera jadinii NRRL Y-1542]ODV70607.1 hypothetical protein CYBJADRAFT_69540 [Cyberlindnera jadinii NRRL Y-1542]ODV76259.1 hypothetical protein CYBJADRAFT_9178 [Cyberlindnera jadinii NRRL Y-1542]
MFRINSIRLINTSSRAATGNSFKSFAEYRKAAIYNGPLKKSMLLRSHGEFKPATPEDRELFAQEAARHSAYKESI